MTTTEAAMKARTRWTFPNSGHHIGGEKDNVFDILTPYGGDRKPFYQRLAFTFRAEIIGDVYRFLGRFDSPDNNTDILVPVFVHVEPQLLPEGIVNMLVQPTFKLVECELTEAVALAELRRILALVPDGHVMCESLAPANDYTGERITVDWDADRAALNQYAQRLSLV